MIGWQWHQWDHMQIICTSLQTDNHASTSPLSFHGLMPYLPPTNCIKALQSRTFGDNLKQVLTLSHWAHFTVLRFIFAYVLLHACVEV